MASWSNSTGGQFDHHMESSEGYHLHVTDANEDDAALYAKNSKDPSDDPQELNARALKVDGMAEIIANVFEQAPGSTGLLVSNASRNPFGRALKVQTPFEGDPPATWVACPARWTGLSYRHSVKQYPLQF